MIVTAMRFLFQVPIHGSVLMLAFLSLPYIFVSLSLGILISSKATSQAQAMQLAFLTILPSIFFPATSSRERRCPNFSMYSATLFQPPISLTSREGSFCEARHGRISGPTVSRFS